MFETFEERMNSILVEKCCLSFQVKKGSEGQDEGVPDKLMEKSHQKCYISIYF